jgi:Kef-type K+ transport system membrane component KefB
VNTSTVVPVYTKPRPAWVGPAALLSLIAAAVGLFALIRWFGEGLTAPEPIATSLAPTAKTGGAVEVVFHVIATLAAVIALGHLLGRLCRSVGQPPVIGEVIAGILLGPSCLGAISPAAMHLLIPAADVDVKGQVPAALKAVSQLGVVLYMFLVGLELNAAKLKKTAGTAAAVSVASIALPFVLGAATALWLYPILSHRGVPFTSFALFFGAALSVTAFPVLARILADRKQDKTALGVLALGCAAADDLIAWCLLALVVGVSKADVGGVVFTVAASGVFVAVLFVAVRPLVAWACRKLDAHPGPLPAAVLPLTLVAVLVAALATEVIGVHAVFGAFLLGAVIPHDSRLATELSGRFKDVVTVLLLPAFFALTGLRTEIGLISGWQNWLICGAIILVATAGKFGGTVAAAKLTGLNWRVSAALGAMMNTRGLMALIVLDIGLKEGVISPTLFAMMVLMALATTLATAPALKWLGASSPPRPS